MDKLLIRGGKRLNGEVPIAGAKNAALPELCAALLAAEPMVLANVPKLQDVATMAKLLRHMGVAVERSESEPSTMRLDATRITAPEAPYELVKTMRASILVLGPLLARLGQARVSLPGGCAIGSRPVDQHIKGLQAMGAEIVVEHGYIVAKATRLRGARITTDMVTVTGTENLLMAAALAEGETVLENAAQEPEVTDLAELLVKMGARIEGLGTGRLRVQGVERLHAPKQAHRIIPDRIETGTFLCAVAAAGGDVKLTGTCAEHLDAVIDKLREAGAEIEVGSDWMRVRMDRRPKAVGFRTSEYPAFPTDMQAQLMVVDCIAEGSARITETIFENRYMHVNELVRLGAKIEVDGDWMRVRMDRRPKAVGFRTSEYPAFPTDMQAQLMVVDCIAEGSARITETIFENRYMHVNELVRLGAKIEVDGHTAVVYGVPQLSGATVMATDLRASASLVIAGLVAEGQTLVDRIYHLDRGYDRMEAKLRAVGADIERVS